MPFFHIELIELMPDIIGQLPSQLILTKVRPSIWLPSLELAWSFLVMGMAGAKNVKTLYALRLFVGLLEASAYPGIMTLLGNWYTPMELGNEHVSFKHHLAQHRCSLAIFKPLCMLEWMDVQV